MSSTRRSQKKPLCIAFLTALVSLALRSMPVPDTPPLTVRGGAVLVSIAGILLGLMFVIAGLLLLIRIRRE